MERRRESTVTPARLRRAGVGAALDCAAKWPRGPLAAPEAALRGADGKSYRYPLASELECYLVMWGDGCRMPKLLPVARRDAAWTLHDIFSRAAANGRLFRVSPHRSHTSTRSLRLTFSLPPTTCRSPVWMGRASRFCTYCAAWSSTLARSRRRIPLAPRRRMWSPGTSGTPHQPE